MPKSVWVGSRRLFYTDSEVLTHGTIMEEDLTVKF